ncbi:hypothetical protein BJ546DRAFT_982207 [Cryomyces antarcticus]
MSHACVLALLERCTGLADGDSDGSRWSGVGSYDSAPCAPASHWLRRCESLTVAQAEQEYSSRCTQGGRENSIGYDGRVAFKKIESSLLMIACRTLSALQPTQMTELCQQSMFFSNGDQSRSRLEVDCERCPNGETNNSNDGYPRILVES